MYRFWDLQCTCYSAHKTLEGMVDMLIVDLNWEMEVDSYERITVQKHEEGELTKDEMKELVRLFEYEITEYKLVPGFGKRFTFSK